MTQGLNADRRAHRLNPVTPQVGDLVLLNTEHYNLMLQSQKLAPKWNGPLPVEELYSEVMSLKLSRNSYHFWFRHFAAARRALVSQKFPFGLGSCTGIPVL
eukprot:2629286-Rhodomonas_salina.1